MNVAEKWSHMASCGSLPYGILANVKQFMGYMEKSIYGLMYVRLYYGSAWLKIGIANNHVRGACN
jgi:hypothetical protein